ncbi:hypothetical protein [Taibaiella soli]|uniref:DUF4625 domain-containing protein n=1 Tax=Taibaiella soli TaxID=1649169 RepID=A0A2W2ABU2_9BACT|nr:hypothetical protein [Taibaiella soli]PZF72885.1 hypothetical protein DN068_10760 [Taibaiella soli]
MRFLKTGILGIILLAIGATSCQKKDNTPATADQVQMTIMSPNPGQIFQQGDSVHINAKVTFVTELHGYELKITDTSTGFIVYDDAEHVHDDHFDISDTWFNSVAQATSLRLDLIAVVDHDGTVATKTIYLQTHP